MKTKTRKRARKEWRQQCRQSKTRIECLERLVDDLREAGDALDRQSEVPTVAHNRWRKVRNEAVVALGGMVSMGARQI